MEKHDIFYVLVNEKETPVTESQLCDLLSNGLSTRIGFEQVGVAPQQYTDARNELLQEGMDEEDICREDVWARVLMKEHALFVTEPDGDFTEHKIFIRDIARGLEKYFQEAPANGCGDIDDLLCTGDCIDADCVLQYAAYGEIIFG